MRRLLMNHDTIGIPVGPHETSTFRYLAVGTGRVADERISEVGVTLVQQPG
jgi:hypothetical protein